MVNLAVRMDTSCAICNAIHMVIHHMNTRTHGPRLEAAADSRLSSAIMQRVNTSMRS